MLNAVRLTCQGLTKHFPGVRAVDNLTFDVEPGRVTAFLGRNGAGKTTTMRMLVGLVHPTSGSALIDGREYRVLAEPMRTVGAALEGFGHHPGRTPQTHLATLCLAAGVPVRRVDEALGLVGLDGASELYRGAAGNRGVMRRRARALPAGIRQRLNLAAALLGDPAVLVLDEPTATLDPPSRELCQALFRRYAGEGRTVFLSSHLLSEVEGVVDDLVVIDEGRLIFRGTLVDLLAGAGPDRVRARCPEPTRLRDALPGATAEVHGDAVVFAGVEPGEVYRAAVAAGVELVELTTVRPNLNGAFRALIDEGQATRSGRSR